MIALNKYWKFVGLYTFALLVVGVGIALHGGQASAITGASATYFPETSTFGQGRSYALVEVTGANVKNPATGQLNAFTKMKARTTVANIYVPKSMEGQTISFTILNGCHSAVARDTGTGAGSTIFLVNNNGRVAPTNLSFKTTSDPSCAGASDDIPVSFIATPNEPAAANYFFSRTYENNTEYNIYQFIAHGNMVEAGSSNLYINSFGLRPDTAGTEIGISDMPVPCDKLTYPISCPDIRGYTDAIGRTFNDSLSYTSFYGPSPSWALPNYSQAIIIKNSCTVHGTISLYDLDANSNSGLDQNNIKIVLRHYNTATGAWDPMPATMLNGGVYNELSITAMQLWGPGIPGIMRAHAPFGGPYGGNNNEYMDIPAGDPTFTPLTNFVAGESYMFSIENIDSDNALQILPAINHCPGPPPDICSNIPGDQATVPAPYSDPDGDKICDQPDSAPTITFTEVCDNVAGSYYINVATSDADGGTSTVSYNGAGFTAGSQTSNSFNLTRDPLSTVTLSASTNGVYPTYYRSPQSASAGPTSFGPCIYPFTLGPSSSIPVLDDDELPTKVSTVTFTTTYSSTSPVGVNAIFSNKQAYVLKAGAINAPYLVGPETGNVSFTGGVVDTRSDLSLVGRNLVAGDAVCSVYNINHTSGHVDRAGNPISNPSYPLAGASGNTPQCRTIVDRPYLRTYGADVAAGSGFGVNCTGVATDIKAFARFVSSPLAGYVGAGSQLGVFANGTVNGFVSMSMRDALGAAAVPGARTFSNQVSGSFGGNYGAKFCSNDFWANRGTLSSVAAPALNSLASGSYSYNPGVLNIAAGVGGQISNKIAIFVDGDVVINKNLVYRTTSGWADVNAIPSIYIVARGDIYIDSSVTQLDGYYIAQPTAAGVKGRIFTCSDGGAAASNATILGACRTNALKINGAFVADHVNFMRSKGTVRAGAAATPVPPATCTAANPVVVYTDWRFMGSSRALAQGVYDTATGGTSPVAYRNISSVRVPPGCAVLLEDQTNGTVKQLLSDWTVNGGGDFFNDAATRVTVTSVPVTQKQYGFMWSYQGAIDPANNDCVLFDEPSDVWWTNGPGTPYADNYLCVRKGNNLGLSFSANGPIAGKTCISVNESADVNGWGNNYLCSNTNLGLVFKSNGPIAGMYCTAAVSEPGDTHLAAVFWDDNYICEPSAPVIPPSNSLTGELPTSANIAEIFDFSPELLIAPPGIRPTDTSKNFDSIASLPPAL